MNAKLFFTLAVAAALLAATGTASGQTPVGTAFTYQGSLNLSGSPLTDTADFEFSLWDAATTPPGTQIGSTVSVGPVNVVDGLFTVVIDFGVDPWVPNEARWLQIAVRSPSGTGTFQTLAPRQELTPTPFSLATRGINVDAADNVGLGTPTPAEKLHVDGNILATGTLQSGTSITIDGTTDTITASSGLIDFDDEDLVTDGRIGIGLTLGPAPHPLQIECSTGWGAVVHTDSALGIAVTGRSSDPSTIHATCGVAGHSAGLCGMGVHGVGSDSSTGHAYSNYGGYFESMGVNGKGVYGWASNIAGSGTYGGEFESAGQFGTGVKGFATNVTGARTFGGHFRSDGVDGIGVFGLAGVTLGGETFGGYFRNANPDRGAGLYATAAPGGTGAHFYVEQVATESPKVAVFEALYDPGGTPYRRCLRLSGRGMNVYDPSTGYGDTLYIQGRSDGDVDIALGGGDVDIATGGGDVSVGNDLLVKGEIWKRYSSALTHEDHHAAPLAYGRVSLSGNLLSGTENISSVNRTSVGRYEISITGVTVNHLKHVILLTTTSDATPTIATAYSGGGDLWVTCWDMASNRTDEGFSFVIYDPDPRP